MNNKKYVRMVVLLCAITYFISYITRINYGSLVHEIRLERGDLVSLALTGLAITYGVGQLLSGYMGDKIKPENLVFYALLTTVCMNFLLPIFDNVWVMTVIWCINGLAQAFMWPPLVKYMTELLTDEEYTSGCVKVSWGASIGTIFIYLLSPFCVKFFSWKYVFYISALAALIMAFIWKRASVLLANKRILSDDDKKEDVIKEETVEPMHWNFGLILVLGGIMLAIALQGILRDGIQDWMPTYIDETYNLGSAISILTGVLMPIFSIISLKVASVIYTKWLKTETVCAAVIFAVAAVASFILCMVFDKTPVISVIISALVTASMHGVNFALIGMIPPKFKKYGKVSFMSGLLNSCTYIGAAIAG